MHVDDLARRMGSDGAGCVEVAGSPEVIAVCDTEDRCHTPHVRPAAVVAGVRAGEVDA